MIRRTAHHTTRSGFTLLEVVLATALGAMVIMVCMALLRSMERLERPLAIRQQELADLHRARTVIQRAMSSLVMSDTTPPVNPNARRSITPSTSSTTTDDASAKSAFETTAEATATKQQQQARPPARLLLEADQSDELKAMLQQVGVPVGSASSIQRMEVVVDTPPIAPTFRAELGDVIAATYAQNKTAGGKTASSASGLSNGSALSAASASSNNSSSFGGTTTSASATSNSARGTALRSRLQNAVQSGAANGNRRSLSLNGNSANAAKSGSLRGAFEIRPMLTDANLEARRDGKPILYELWWSPLPAAKDTSKTNPLSANSTAAATQTIDDPRTVEAWGEPVLLADNLVKCRWQFFSTGEKRSAHSAVWDKELPAYVEFEIQTKTGLYENWMFEIGWSKGPELATTATDAGGGGSDTALPTGAQGPGGTGGPNGGPNGGPRGPGQGPPRGPRNNQPPQVHPPGGGGPRYDNIPTQAPR